MDIFIKIERILREKKISNNQLIKALGFTPAGFYKMVKVNDLKLSTLENICTYLNINLNDLLSSELSEVSNLSIVSEPIQAYKTSKPQSKSLTNQLILKDISHIETLLNNIKNSLQ